MKILLDTCAFLWMIVDDPSLSSRARETLEDGGNELYLSAASCWEIAIKCGLGKIKLTKPPERLVPEQLHRLSIRPLPVLASHALRTASLQPLHRDPFDRLLIAQAAIERLPILTPDRQIKAYGVPVVW